MRAALLTAVKEPFEVEDIDYLDPTPGRVTDPRDAGVFQGRDDRYLAAD